MIISLHGVSLTRVASTPQEAVEIAANAGFNYLEIPVTSWQINPETATKADIEHVKNTLATGGVEASSLGMIWPRDYVMVTSSTIEWKRNINYAIKLFELSATLGIQVMNLGGPRVRRVPDYVTYYDGLRMFVKFWKEACQHAEDFGVIVGIEHILQGSTNVANSTKQIMDLVNAIDSPSFQINAQIHQMAYIDLDVPSAIRTSGSMIRLVHIADVSGFNPIVEPVSFLTPGKGKLDFMSIFQAFKDISYNGEFCMEPSPSMLNGDVVRELSDGREFLEAKWRQA